MADFGELPYLNAAVQVIPVLAVIVVADEFIRRDAVDPIHRLYASTAVAVGLLFGIVGEIFALQALLTGPTRQTLPTVNAGLLALAATALGPRLAELHVPHGTPTSLAVSLIDCCRESSALWAWCLVRGVRRWASACSSTSCWL